MPQLTPGRTAHLRGNKSLSASDQVASFVLNNGPPVIPSDVKDSKLTKDVKKNEEINQSTSSTNGPSVLEVSKKPSESQPDPASITNLQQLLNLPQPSAARPKAPRLLEPAQNSDSSQTKVLDQNNPLSEPYLTSDLQSNKVVTEIPVLTNNELVTSSISHNADTSILIPKNEIINPTFLAENPQFISPLESAINAVVSNSQPVNSIQLPINPIQSQSSINNSQNPGLDQTNNSPANVQPIIPNIVASSFEQFLNIPSFQVDQTQIKNPEAISLGQPSDNSGFAVANNPSSNQPFVPQANQQPTFQNENRQTDSIPELTNQNIQDTRLPIQSHPDVAPHLSNEQVNIIIKEDSPNTGSNSLPSQNSDPPINVQLSVPSDSSLTIQSVSNNPPQIITQVTNTPNLEKRKEIFEQTFIPNIPSRNEKSEPEVATKVKTGLIFNHPSERQLAIDSQSDLERQLPVISQSDLEKQLQDDPQPDANRQLPVNTQTDLDRQLPANPQSDLERQLPVDSQSDLDKQLQVNSQPDVNRQLPVNAQTDSDRQLPANHQSDLEGQLPVDSQSDLVNSKPDVNRQLPVNAQPELDSPANPQVTVNNEEITTSRALGIFRNDDVPEADQV